MKRRLAIKQRLIQKRKELAQHISETPPIEALSTKGNTKSEANSTEPGAGHAGD